jgi:hypothetical protein
LSLAAQEQEKKDNKDNKRIVQKYSKIYVYQGQADIIADNKDKAKVVNIQNAQLAKPWRKAYLKIMQSFLEDY